MEQEVKTPESEPVKTFPIIKIVCHNHCNSDICIACLGYCETYRDNPQQKTNQIYQQMMQNSLGVQ